MPARVVVALTEEGFADQIATALRASGIDAIAYTSSMGALDALEAARTAEVLVTSIQFPPATPNGISLARVARSKRPGIRVLFVGETDFSRYTAGLGEFMASPVSVSEVVCIAMRLLPAGD